MAETAGLLEIDYGTLAELLGLPEGAEIVRIDSQEFYGGVAICVRGPGLPLVEEGQLLPKLLLRVERGDDGRCRFAGWEPMRGA